MNTRLKQRTYNYSTFDTSIGTCAVAWADAGIVAARLPEKTQRLLVEKLQSYLRAELVENQAPPAVIKKAIAAMRSHLEGKLNDLSSIVVDYDRVPPFHQKVYEAARKIPPGVTVSYGELARAAGSPGAARAVGQALARNPFAIVVPCHRIIAHNGGAGGFSAFGGCATKEKMLKIEGYIGGKKVKKETGMRFVPAEPGMLQFDPELAVQHLCQVDKKMAKLIAAVGPFRLHVDEMVPPFEALAQSIVYQQLTGKAAGTIFGRVKAIYKSDRLPHPKKILQTPDEQLRAAGLSTAKTAALKDLAAKQIAGVIPSLEELYELSDEEIIERLTSVRGVGRWTVEMLLMFRLGRPDVLPVADYGVRKGFALTYGRGDNLPTPKELGIYGERWKPYRSVASWYLWRSLELGNKPKN
jgi:methylated-DNA-[protein]-cysteine S-methyltransferase